MVVRQEISLLRSNGHAVRALEEDNNRMLNTADTVKTAIRCTYSRQARQLVEQEIRRFQPDIVHVHNFFPRFSPAVLYACRALGIPVVQTLHNFRLACPNATLFRNGITCEDCVGRMIPWPAIKHRCYRENLLATMAVAHMLTMHRALGTWERMPNLFVAPTKFARGIFVSAGIPMEKIWVKPNFILHDPGVGDGNGRYALFVGRLSPEKGIQTLLKGWDQISAKWRLKVIGDGPMAPIVRKAAKQCETIEWLGACDHAEVIRQMGAATALIMPSRCYETFGMVAAEAFSVGLPVVASQLGAMAEIVAHGQTGRLFAPGDADALAEQINWIFEHPHEVALMRTTARREYELKYTAEVNYTMLMDIYRHAVEIE